MLCNVKEFADGTTCMVWSPESQGQIRKGMYVREQGLETKSTKKELMVLGMCLPVLRCKDPKYYTVWYNPCGWVSKKRLQKPRKAFWKKWD